MTDLTETDTRQDYEETLYNVSVEEQVCEQCKDENNILPAMGWCETCDELLCNECYRTHCRPKKMRGHQLYSITDMMTRKQIKGPGNMCKKHEGELLNYFCEDHSELGCSQCFDTKHRQCIKVVRIAEVKTNESDEFKALEKFLVELEVRLETNEDIRERNVALTTRQYEKAISDIKNDGEQLKLLIDKLVEEQMSEAKQNMETNLLNMAKIADMNTDMRDRIQSSKEMLAAMRGDNRQLFIATKHLQREMEILDSKQRESEHGNKVSEYMFVLNSDLAYVLEKVTELGSLKDQHVLRMESATDELVDEVMEVRRFKRMSQFAGCGPGEQSDAIQLSVDHNIRLQSVLILPFLKDDTEVTLTISEGEQCLIECCSTHKKTDKDVVDVVVANERAPPGLTLQKGHMYDIDVTIKGDWSRRGEDGQAEVIVEGVKFFFSSTVSSSDTTGRRGQICGFTFTHE